MDYSPCFSGTGSLNINSEDLAHGMVWDLEKKERKFEDTF